ncbi:hypothetical protein [Ekhidna sp.]|uniref:hypothetical protein n=1 Tax=Ekhidna sp. TaxID=2608089 RepID=UPI0032EDFC05
MRALKTILIIFIFFISGCAQSQSKKQTLEYLKDNFSYEWNRLDSEIDEDLIEPCKKHYQKNGEFEDRTDDMKLQRVYRVEYKSTYYLILEFDFVDIFDHIVDYVIWEDSHKVIGFFYRSLA